MAKKHSYTPTSKPVVPNPGRTFAVPGTSSGTRPDDVPYAMKQRAGKGMVNRRGTINQQPGSTKVKTT